MDLFFPEDHLNRMTPEETHITSLTAEPYPDGYRLHVNLEVTPFQKRPHIEVALKDAGGSEIASTSIIEPMSWKHGIHHAHPRRAEQSLYPGSKAFLSQWTGG